MYTVTCPDCGAKWTRPGIYESYEDFCTVCGSRFYVEEVDPPTDVGDDSEEYW